jgi:peptide-methionine (S)-S-oxide reductase
MATQLATLGGGCFWCLEAVYVELEGVQEAVSGYAGGHIDNPTYRQVCSIDTGHAEVVQVSFDDSVISYEDILNVFFTIHDPTTLNRQGNDVGPQYRSVIFYHDEQQKATAEAVMQRFTQEGVWEKPIVTQLEPAPKFWIAEDYHQNYFANNPAQPYCQFIIAPKVAKLRQQFMHQLKA